VRACSDLGVEVLTLYAFSTENWQRPDPEVNFLLRLAAEYAIKELDELNRHNVRVRRIGRRQGVPEHLLATMDRGVRATAANTGLTLNIAFNYGGRQEIADAARAVVAACHQGDLDPATLDEATFSRYLYTAGQPDPDLVIRTSGESRLSNFLIWQLGAGALFWITPVLWPDFGPKELDAALAAWRAEAASP
jgi:undecaprenyl diphosphate synthase